MNRFICPVLQKLSVFAVKEKKIFVDVRDKGQSKLRQFKDHSNNLWSIEYKTKDF